MTKPREALNLLIKITLLAFHRSFSSHLLWYSEEKEIFIIKQGDKKLFLSHFTVQKFINHSEQPAFFYCYHRQVNSYIRVSFLHHTYHARTMLHDTTHRYDILPEKKRKKEKTKRILQQKDLLSEL